MIMLDRHTMRSGETFEGFLGGDSFLRGVTWGDMDKGQIRVVIHKDSGCVVPFPSEPSLDLADETWS